MINSGVTPEQIKLVKSFFPPNYAVYLFGSRIVGGWQEYSDLDICIKNPQKVDIGELSFIREKFENSDLPFTVDLVDYQRCDQRFKNIIDNTAIPINDVTK